MNDLFTSCLSDACPCAFWVVEVLERRLAAMTFLAGSWRSSIASRLRFLPLGILRRRAEEWLSARSCVCALILLNLSGPSLRLFLVEPLWYSPTDSHEDLLEVFGFDHSAEEGDAYACLHVIGQGLKIWWFVIVLPEPHGFLAKCWCWILHNGGSPPLRWWLMTLYDCWRLRKADSVLSVVTW